MRKIAVGCLLSIALGACSSGDSVIEPRQQGGPDPTILSSTYFDGVVVAHASTLMGQDGPATAFTQTSRFYSSGGAVVQADSVLFDGSVVDQTFYNESYAAPFNGVPLTWRVVGNADVASFIGTCPTPNIVQISSHAMLMDTVDVSNGFTVLYGNTGCDSVAINFVFNNTLSTKFGGYSGPARSQSRTASFASTGSSMVPPTLLAGFPSTGVATINVACRKHKDTTVAGKNYRMYAVATASTSVYLKP